MLINGNDGGIYEYDIQNNTKTYLADLPYSSDIAMTDTYMWIYSSNNIKEYNISLNPWSYSFNRDISMSSVGTGAGLTSKSNTLLVKGGESIYEVDITNSGATQIKLFDLPIRGQQCYVSGDIYYNPYTGRYIITYEDGIDYYLGEFESDGTIWNETDLGAQSITQAWGLFSKDQQLYLGNSTANGADIYTVNMTNLTTTFYNSITLGTGDGLSGAAQSPACEDSSFTRTPTPTPTLTPTQTPSVTPTNATAQLDITNDSLDIQITSVYVNGVNTSVIGGSLPNSSGSGTNLSTTQIGTCTIQVNYYCSVSGQRITLTDSDLVSTCINTSTGNNAATFTNQVVASYQNVLIDAEDATC